MNININNEHRSYVNLDIIYVTYVYILADSQITGKYLLLVGVILQVWYGTVVN